MRYLVYSEPERVTYPICFVVPSIQKDEIKKAYLDPYGLDPDEVLVLNLHYEQGKKKTPVAIMKEYIKEALQPALDEYDVQYVLVADSEYFKILGKLPKAEANLGYVVQSAFGKQKVIYVPSYKQIFYDPDKVKSKIRQGVEALITHASGTYQEPGHDVIKFADYPQTPSEIKQWLDKLLEMDCDLTCDIEAFSLKHYDSGIGTISFAWNQGEGIAFPVDYLPIANATEAPFGVQGINYEVRDMLREFFIKMKRKLIFHNIAYDAYALIYQLFMKDILDTEGMLFGMEMLLGNWDCTKVISYLATNSTAGNNLGLKDQSQEFAGNYAIDEIKDIRRQPLDKLLEYNLIDGLSTWYVHNKNWNRMVADQQLPVYTNLFKPATVDIIQTQLTGMPVYMPRVHVVRDALQTVFDDAVARMHISPLVQRFKYRLKEKWIIKRNAKLKVKRMTMADADLEAQKPDSEVAFNPNSYDQMKALLYEMLQLPVIAVTDSNQPALDGDTVKNLRNHTKDPQILDVLNAFADYVAVNKILTSFIPALLNAVLGPDGWHYLFGNFNLGGTVSGRLSSSNPNLQNLPANVEMILSDALMKMLSKEVHDCIAKGKLHLGKLIKSCFQAPPGWIFAGLDFSSLEDRISGLTTKDPEKLKVYTDGYDGHCLRAYAYFGSEMPDIDPKSVQSINSIQDLYKALRQDSKAPTFALTYQGTFKTLMNNCGFSEEKAKMVEARYKELYKVSIDWVQDRLNEASRDGYITAAFGLRVRTPKLKQVIRGTSKTPYEAEAEGRTAGNALGQSWCLLNSRAVSDFMGQVRNSPYRLMIRPCAQIHDASYYLIREDMGALLFTNKHLVKAVEWQDDPVIWHDEVKLGGELSLFYPSWKTEITIPNHATEDEILQVIDKALNP